MPKLTRPIGALGKKFWPAGVVYRGGVLLALTISVACTSDPEKLGSEGARISVSLLAVGDTGEPWGMLPQLFEGQLAVGVAMQREHAIAPVDALILLGDNFYPDGLLPGELLPRLIENVARPYCAFVDPSAELTAALGGACADVKKSVPRLFAVVGNHDLSSPGSHDLQRHQVPRFIRNWDMPTGDGPAVRDLRGGLSLILLDSAGPWGDAEVRELTAALRTARGPWRIVVGHRPPIAGHPGLSAMVARAARDSETVVHAYLAGHVHALVAIRGVPPAPALTVIAGSGSHVGLQKETEYRMEGADMIVEALGFVRIDVVTQPAPARLSVTFFRAPPSAALAFLGHRAIARYEIAADGSVERGPAEP